MPNKKNDGKKKGFVDKVRSTKVGKFMFDSSLPGMTYNAIQSRKKKKADAATAKAKKDKAAADKKARDRKYGEYTPQTQRKRKGGTNNASYSYKDFLDLD